MPFDRATLRILDASANRAREALRTIEDAARFLRDDRQAAERLKRLRHQLRDLVQRFGVDELLAARDAAGDVGRGVTTAGEACRAGLDDVLRAAFGRLTEAARSLAEYGKLSDPAAAAIAEDIRFAAYELEQRLILHSPYVARFAQVRVYVIVTEALCRRPWLETARAALAGGAQCLQLREKGLPDGELLRRAHELRAATLEHDALLFINDRPDVAALCDADGVHVGQDDLPVAAARRLSGPRRLIGLSTHDPEQFDAGRATDADVLAVGPVFATTTKPQSQVAGLQLVCYARTRADRPLVAIGGITPGNAAGVFAAGATCVCVCAAVLQADDPAEAVGALAAQAPPRAGGPA